MDLPLLLVSAALGLLLIVYVQYVEYIYATSDTEPFFVFLPVSGRLGGRME